MTNLPKSDQSNAKKAKRSPKLIAKNIVELCSTLKDFLIVTNFVL